MSQGVQLAKFGQFVTVNTASNTVTFSPSVAMNFGGSAGSNGQFLVSNGSSMTWSSVGGPQYAISMGFALP